LVSRFDFKIEKKGEYTHNKKFEKMKLLLIFKIIKLSYFMKHPPPYLSPQNFIKILYFDLGERIYKGISFEKDF